MLTILKWQETFENADTRKRQRLGWFLCPTGVDSAGYLELMSHGEAGVRAYGVFVAICQWSATCVPHVRGTLARSNGKAMLVRQIAAQIRMPEQVVAEAIELLTDEDIGWLVDDGGSLPSKNVDAKEICRSSATSMPPPAEDLPVICQSSPAFVKGEGEGEEEGEGDPQGVCPSEQIVKQFNRTFGLKCQLTANRRKQLAVRWKDLWWRDNWAAALQRGSLSRFLKGDSEGGWRITLEWFLRPDSCLKIMEGNYDNRGTPSGSAAQRREQSNADAFAAVFGNSTGDQNALLDEEPSTVHAASISYVGSSAESVRGSNRE